MVQDAEMYRTEDESNRQKIEATNVLENYCSTMRNTLQEEKLKDKIEGSNKDKIEKAVQETPNWSDKNQLAEKDESEEKPNWSRSTTSAASSLAILRTTWRTPQRS